MPVLRSLTDLLLPPRCPACGEPATATWCGTCLAVLARLALPGGAPLTLAQDVRAVAAYAYEGVARDTLLEVKVRHRGAAVEAMGVLMRARLDLPEPGSRCAWTWVPSRRRRVRARGVDVARVLAGPSAVPLLRRTRDTAEQKHLPASQRRVRQRGAFTALRQVPPAVVLVDDVRTSGATALAAAAALRQAGARRVLVATFAAAAGRSDRSPTGG